MKAKAVFPPILSAASTRLCNRNISRGRLAHGICLVVGRSALTLFCKRKRKKEKSPYENIHNWTYPGYICHVIAHAYTSVNMKVQISSLHMVANVFHLFHFFNGAPNRIALFVF